MIKFPFCFLLCLTVFAQGKKHEHQHSKTKGAHEHGTAQINLAVEGKVVDIELHVPAMGIVGFERIATSAADKKKQSDALAKLKANIAQIVIFEPAMACNISVKKIEIEQEKPDHAEVDGDFTAICAQYAGGTKVLFGLTKFFPAIHAVKVQAVGSTGSNGAEIQNDSGTLVLPK